MNGRHFTLERQVVLFAPLSLCSLSSALQLQLTQYTHFTLHSALPQSVTVSQSQLGYGLIYTDLKFFLFSFSDQNRLNLKKVLHFYFTSELWDSILGAVAAAVGSVKFKVQGDSFCVTIQYLAFILFFIWPSFLPLRPLTPALYCPALLSLTQIPAHTRSLSLSLSLSQHWSTARYH